MQSREKSQQIVWNHCDDAGYSNCLDCSGLAVYHAFMTKRALVIVNPAARGAPKLERLRKAVSSIAGWESTLEPTTAAGHATELAREAAQRGVDAVVACGGDGTMNEVANGLARSETAMATVRGGTANVWAKEIGAPKDVDEAVRVLENGELRSMDLGLAGDRHFLLMAGIGFDASIVQRVSPRLKRWSGALAYAVPSVLRAFGHRSINADLVVDAEALATPLYWLLLGNTRNYGGVLNLTHQAKADDGLLDICLLQHGGLPRIAWLALWALLKRHQDRAEVVFRTASMIEIRTPGLPVQLDGDYFGETPMTFGVAPNALRVMVPRGQASALFS